MRYCIFFVEELIICILFYYLYSPILSNTSARVCFIDFLLFYIYKITNNFSFFIKKEFFIPIITYYFLTYTKSNNFRNKI